MLIIIIIYLLQIQLKLNTYVYLYYLYLDSLGAHKDQITKLRLFEDLGLLVSAGKDGFVKVYYYI